MKKMINAVFKFIGKGFVFLLLFLLLLAIFSANWFVKTFGKMDFSIVVYQLFSPMEGTASEILGKYCDECLRPVIWIAIIIILLYIFCEIIFKKCYLKIKMTLFKKEVELLVDRKWIVIANRIIGSIGFIILTVVLVNSIIVLEIPQYIKEITQSSTLFEEEYVNPDETIIRFPEQKRNLLLIYLESMESTYASRDVGGAKNINYIPELTKLAQDNLNFSDNDQLGGAHNYAAGWTMASLLASSAGVPYKLPIEGNSAGQYEYFLPGITSLGDILLAEGYKNYFMCGSEAEFGGRKDFYLQHGNYEILDYEKAKEEGIIPEDYYVFWGMEDEKLYQYAQKKLTDIAESGEVFNFTMLTVDTHHPEGYNCELCGSEYPEQYANAIACASKQLYEFIDWVKLQPWYDNTTVVIMGDHKSMNATFWDDIGEYERNIYNCFINYPKELEATNHINREFSLLDMFPTMLSSIGAEIQGNRLGLGVNLFSDEKTLPERLGRKNFVSQLNKYSNYYFNEFVVGSVKDYSMKP